MTIIFKHGISTNIIQLKYLQAQNSLHLTHLGTGFVVVIRKGTEARGLIRCCGPIKLFTFCLL